MELFIIPDAKPEISLKASDLKIGQSLVMWAPTFSRKQHLAPIISVKVRAKTTVIEIEQGPLKVVGKHTYRNDELVRVVEE